MVALQYRPRCIDASFCHVCMTAKMKGLQTKAHSKDEAFIICGFKNWKEAFEISEDLDCHKYYSIMKNLSETNLNVDVKVKYLYLFFRIQFLYRQGLDFRGNKNEGMCQD